MLPGWHRRRKKKLCEYTWPEPAINLCEMRYYMKAECLLGYVLCWDTVFCHYYVYSSLWQIAEKVLLVFVFLSVSVLWNCAPKDENWDFPVGLQATVIIFKRTLKTPAGPTLRFKYKSDEVLYRLALTSKAGWRTDLLCSHYLQPLRFAVPRLKAIIGLYQQL